MFGLLNTLVDLTTNVTKVVVAPVEIVAGVANAAIKPMAEAVGELVEEVKSIGK